MEIREWPFAPNTFDWWLESNTKTFRSEFNGALQVVRFPGSRWKCALSYTGLDDDRARILEAFVVSLDGEFGRVRMRSYGRKGRQPLGSPVVAVAEQSGSSLLTKDWLPEQVVLHIGDYFTVNDELKQVTAMATSSLQGSAILHFSPPLRTAPPVGSVIETAHPTGIFKLADNAQGKFKRQRKRGVRSTVNLELEETW